MTSVWRQRPGSRFTGAGLGLLLAFTAVTAGGQPATVTVDQEGVGRAARQRLADFAGQDRRWLRRLPPAEAELTRSAADTSLARIRALVAGAAGTAADTVVVVRPVEGRLRDRWLARGYLSARVTVRGDTLRVQPGPVWTVGNWELSGDDFPGREHLVTTWLPRAGDTFVQAELALGIERVLRGCGEAGYPFARWVTRKLEMDTAAHQVMIKASLLPGQLAWLGPIGSNLTEPRANRFLARSSGLQPGVPFRHSDLDRAVDRLLARDLYTTVGEPQVYLTSARDTVGVFFPVIARRKTNRLQVVLGLSQREEGGTHLSGEVDLRLPNMGGSGRNLQIGWSDDGQDKSHFGFSYLEPLAFGTGLDMGLGLDNEVQRGSHTRFRLDNSWQLPVVALWGLELGVGWDRTTYPAGDLERTSRVRASGAVLHKRGDRTRSGWASRFAIENGWRSSTLRPDTSSAVAGGSELGEAVTQRIFSVDVAGELWVAPTLSFFSRAAFRQLTGGEPNVPLAEQFRFGGASTLRGYREDEFNGSQAAWGAVEMRIGRPEGSRLYTFYDLGYFEFWSADAAAADPAALLRRRGWPRGYGLGLFARTPGGDLSLAIGFPGTVDFGQAKLHVTLLESF